MKLSKFFENRIDAAMQRNALEKVSEQSLLEKNVDSVIKFYNPEKGSISSWWQRRKSEARAKELVALNQEQQLVIEQAVMLEQAVMNGSVRKAEFQTFIARHAALFIELQVHVELVKKAARKGLTLDAYIRLKEEKQRSKIRIKEYHATREPLPNKETEREISEIRTKEYMEKMEADLQNDIRKAEAQLRFNVVGRHLQEQKKIDYVQEMINEQFIKIEKIKADPLIPETAKQPILESMERIIKMYMEQQDESQKRILQS